MVEGLHGDVELVAVLRLHVLDHERLALFANGLGGRHAASLPGGDRRERVRLVHVELGSRDQPVDDLDRHRDLELGLVGAAPPADAGRDPQ